MRVIAGEFKGRRLFAPEGVETRPPPTACANRCLAFWPRTFRTPKCWTCSRARRAGVEAISRGAAFAALCDASAGAARVIERNIALVRAEDRTRLIRADWREALARLSDRRFSLVFLDPPYRMADVYAQRAALLADRGLLAEGAVLVMEHAAKAPLALPAGFEIYDERRYGDTAVALVREAADDRSLPGQF
jgi:16S rRNA (guanine966-N2)-methyltransferase